VAPGPRGGGLASRHENAMTTTFSPIKIVGLDIDMTRPSETAPGLRLMHLTLSDDPPFEWVQLFERERAFVRHSNWRRAWIEGRHIVIDCVPEEIEKYHLNDLKTDVENCNKKYAESLASSDAAIANQVHADQQERERLEKLRSTLKFD
jgi:hypothetical protein